MSLLWKGIAALAVATVMTTSASAQAVVTQRELSLAAAQLMAAAAVEHCRKGGFRISVTIVDSGGQIRLFHKDDGANPHTVDASFRKAYTALTYRMPSGEYGKRATGSFPASHGVLHLPHIATAAGGLPVRAGSTVVGAIGISGTPGAGGAGSGGGGAADEACAQAGIERISKGLGS